jgi:hypothetical protein
MVQRAARLRGWSQASVWPARSPKALQQATRLQVEA